MQALHRWLIWCGARGWCWSSGDVSKQWLQNQAKLMGYWGAKGLPAYGQRKSIGPWLYSQHRAGHWAHWTFRRQHATGHWNANHSSDPMMLDTDNTVLDVGILSIQQKQCSDCCFWMAPWGRKRLSPSISLVSLSLWGIWVPETIPKFRAAWNSAGIQWAF